MTNFSIGVVTLYYRILRAKYLQFSFPTIDLRVRTIDEIDVRGTRTSKHTLRNWIFLELLIVIQLINKLCALSEPESA
jgi:hypothetical protein